MDITLKWTLRKAGSKRFEPGGPIGEAVTTLAQDPKGPVWLADDGVDMARPVPTEGRDSMTSGPSIAADGLRELLTDRDGALWMTREDLGILRVRDPGKLEARRYGSRDRELESFGSKDGFPAGYANKLLEDHEGIVWVGCSNGLIRFRHNQEALRTLRAELMHMARGTSLGALTASIAHEVNQPLSGIVTNASTCLRMLSADPPNIGVAREAARRAIRDGNRASEVVVRLRALFSKKQATAESVDMNDAAREVIALCADDLQRNRVIVARSLAAVLGLFRGIGLNFSR